MSDYPFEMFVHFDCPYCGHKNLLTVRQKNTIAVVTCALDTGGCDRAFVVDIHLSAYAHVRAIADEMERMKAVEVAA